MVGQRAQAVHDVVERPVGRGALVEIVVQGLLEKRPRVKHNESNSRSASLDHWTVTTWCLHYPQCNLATEKHHWKQFIRLHAASSGATKGFILLFSHVHWSFQDL